MAPEAYERDLRHRAQMFFGLPGPLRCESFVRKSGGGSVVGQSEREEEFVFCMTKKFMMWPRRR
jgi:hypothetical protein